MSELADKLNEALHNGPPCASACTHVIYGEWTALGIANVISRTKERGEELAKMTDWWRTQRDRAMDPVVGATVRAVTEAEIAHSLAVLDWARFREVDV